MELPNRLRHLTLNTDSEYDNLHQVWSHKAMMCLKELATIDRSMLLIRGVAA